MRNIATEGDWGDAVYAIGVMHGLLDPPHRLIARKSSMTKHRTDKDIDSFVAMLKRLAEAQPHVAECRAARAGDAVYWDSGGFRLANLHVATLTLFSAHQRHFQSVFPGTPCGDGTKAWLTCGESIKSKNRVVINRTDRYQNPFFPWKEIVGFYGDRLMFVGTRDEHQSFCNEFGNVDYEKTNDLLEVAELIHGSLLFIGNQSCANAIAEGLKHDTIQETSLEIPDCIFKRPNAQHVIDGVVELPGFGGGSPLLLKHGLVKSRFIDTTTVPPKKWLVRLPDGYEERHVFLDNAVRLGMQGGLTREDVMRQNAEEYREYFFHSCHHSMLNAARAALNNAT